MDSCMHCSRKVADDANAFVRSERDEIVGRSRERETSSCPRSEKIWTIQMDCFIGTCHVTSGRHVVDRVHN